MTEATQTEGGEWPLWLIPVPAGADEDQIALVVQAAADAGALGGELRGGELAIYLPRREPELLETIRQELARELARVGWPAADFRLEGIADAPWATAWKATFTTLPIGRRLLIRPDWEIGQPAPAGTEGRLTVWLRPGLGFGTGRHESTRLALELLEEHVPAGAEVLDFGAGNAMLALAAVRLGAARALAVECDPQAHPNALENIELNELSGRIELVAGDRPPAGAGAFDLVLCNVIPSQAFPHFEALAGQLRDANSRIIYSGFLADEKESVEQALRGAGLMPLRWEPLGEWMGCVAGPA